MTEITRVPLQPIAKGSLTKLWLGALLALLGPGDELLMVDSAYEPTRSLCDGLLSRMGVATRYYDPLVGAGIAELIGPATRAVFLESPGSLSFEVQDVPTIAAAAPTGSPGTTIFSSTPMATDHVAGPDFEETRQR